MARARKQTVAEATATLNLIGLAVYPAESFAFSEDQSCIIISDAGTTLVLSANQVIVWHDANSEGINYACKPIPQIEKVEGVVQMTTSAGFTTLTAADGRNVYIPAGMLECLSLDGAVEFVTDTGDDGAAQTEPEAPEAPEETPAPAVRRRRAR
jgi:hypothetical protein